MIPDPSSITAEQRNEAALLLAQWPIFKPLPFTACEEIVAESEIRFYHGGELIHPERDVVGMVVAGHLFLCRSGLDAMAGVLLNIGPGLSLGLSWVLSGSDHLPDVTLHAGTDALLLRMPADSLRSRFHDDIGFWRRVLVQVTTGFERAIDHLSLRTAEVVTAGEDTVSVLMRSLDLRDQETEAHCRRVQILSLLIARTMGVEKTTLREIELGALVHDIGKIGVPDSILRKAGDLSPEDWRVMRTHPALGLQIVGGIAYLEQATSIVGFHHERWDGQGYPQGVAGEQIPLPARIFAVADVYDALTTARTYKKAWTPEEARNEILRDAGQRFDPDVCTAFDACFDEVRKIPAIPRA
jgi:HD-GYP domain-containing protein (c-di-GMP phosphodiesterase class II)